VQLEEELKHKIAEVSRQLTMKEEEVMNVKKRFKEERNTLENDKKRLMVQVEDLKARAEAAEGKLLNLKRDVDESPLAVIRAELAQKGMEVVEVEGKMRQALEERDEVRRRFEQLKRDMVTLKKQMDKERGD
jgi:chromosome segregation ATPase